VLLLLRLFPSVIALVMVGGVMTFFWSGFNPLMVIAATLILLFFLLAKLAGWNWQKPDFWFLLGVPFFFSFSSFCILLFLEGEVIKIGLAILSVMLLWLFTENLFNFVYLPGAYQVNALEYLTLVINIISAFFISASFLALRLYFGLSLWLLVPVFCLLAFSLLVSTFWVCKTEKDKILPVAFGGMILAGELFVALALLPTGFLPNAAFLAVFFYLFFGLLRSFFSGKLSSTIWQHYILAAIIFIGLIIGTARWM